MADINLLSRLNDIDDFNTINLMVLGIIHHNTAGCQLDKKEDVLSGFRKLKNCITTSGMTDFADTLMTLEVLQIDSSFDSFFSFMTRYVELMDVSSPAILEFMVNECKRIVDTYEDRSILEYYEETTNTTKIRKFNTANAGAITDVTAMVSLIAILSVMATKGYYDMLNTVIVELENSINA